MKKTILILAMIFVAVVSQAQTKPTYTFTPRIITIGNGMFVGNYDTTCSCYKDTLLVIMENNTPQIWGKDTIKFYSPVQMVRGVRSDSGIYQGVSLMRTMFSDTVNTYLGSNSGYTSSGIGNSFIGYNAGYAQTGNYNTYVGHQSGNNGTDSYNTYLGANAGGGFAEGKNIIGIGYRAGYGLTTDSMLYIGNTGGSNHFIVGDMKNNSEGLTINGDLTVTGYATAMVPHASFSDTTTQTVTSTTRAFTMKFNTQEDTLCIYDVGDSLIYFRKSGHYEVAISAIADITSGVNQKMELWFQDNGVDIPRSNTIVGISTATTEIVVAVTLMFHMDAGDYIKVKYRGSSTDCQWLFTAKGTSPARPSTPSTVISIKKISDI